MNTKNISQILVLLSALIFQTAASTANKPPEPDCRVTTNIIFKRNLRVSPPLDPAMITLDKGICYDVTKSYSGSENQKAFYIKFDLKIVNLRDKKEVVLKENALLLYKTIDQKPVIIFQSPTVGAFYAFAPGENPTIRGNSFPSGYIPKNEETVSHVSANQITFKVNKDIENSGNYNLYNLPKNSQIRVDFK